MINFYTSMKIYAKISMVTNKFFSLGYSLFMYISTTNRNLIEKKTDF